MCAWEEFLTESEAISWYLKKLKGVCSGNTFGVFALLYSVGCSLCVI